MVEILVRCDKAAPDRNFVREMDLLPVKIGDFSTGFCADEHPGSRIGDPERPAKIDKTVDPAAADIAELEGGSPKEAPPPDLLAKLHGPGRIELPAVHAHGTLIELGKPPIP